MENLYCLVCAERVWGQDDRENTEPDGLGETWTVVDAQREHAEKHPDAAPRWARAAEGDEVMLSDEEVAGWRRFEEVGVDDGVKPAYLAVIQRFALLADQGVIALFGADDSAYLDHLTHFKKPKPPLSREDLADEVRLTRAALRDTFRHLRQQRAYMRAKEADFDARDNQQLAQFYAGEEDAFRTAIAYLRGITQDFSRRTRGI